jgi:hypothetical protein
MQKHKPVSLYIKKYRAEWNNYRRGETYAQRGQGRARSVRARTTFGACPQHIAIADQRSSSKNLHSKHNEKNGGKRRREQHIEGPKLQQAEVLAACADSHKNICGFFVVQKFAQYIYKIYMM